VSRYNILTMLQFLPFETSLFWSLPDPDTDYLHTGENREELVRNIVSYRIANRLEPIERLDLVIEHYLCMHPSNVGKCKEVPLKRGLLQYLKGGMSLIQNLYYKKFVNQEVAENRAKICEPCPCNMFPDSGPFIAWSDMIAKHSVGDREVGNHEKLGNCLGCSCVMKAKVWYAGPFKLSNEEKEIMQACNTKCWQLDEE
jgi:hypothetical protein